MSRRHSAEKREIAVDARFGDAVVSKLINIMMYGGKKAVSEKSVYDAIEKASARAHQETVQTFHTALDHVCPALEVRSRSEERRVGKECVCPCRSPWEPYHYKQHTNE